MDVLADSPPGVEDTAAGQGRVRAVLAGVGLTVLALAVSLIGGVALVLPVLLLGLTIRSLPVFLALTVAGQLGFLAVAYGYARYAGVTVRTAVPDRREVGYAVGGTVVALVVATGLSLVLSVLDLVPGSVLEDPATATPALLLWLALLSVVLVAPAEEFLFRGVIQTRLRAAFGPVGAVSGASLLFGSLHLANYVGTIGPVVAGALVVAATGSVLGVLYERTGNLVVPILAHAAYNVVLFVLAYLSV